MKILLICVKIWTYQYAKDSFEGILLKMLNTLHRPIEDASHRKLINDLMHIVRFLDITYYKITWHCYILKCGMKQKQCMK